MENNKGYTVKQVSKMAGVSPRTLYYYDQIGLIRPSAREENGYRRYTENSLLRLQQVLYYRELGFSLKEIQSILDRPEFDLLAALEEHRRSLQKRQAQLGRLIDTVDRTISYLKGMSTMDSQELFTGFSEEQQKKYEEEAAQKYGREKVEESSRRWSSYSPEERKRILKEGGQIYLDIAAAMPLGPASPQAQGGIARWHQHMRYFYEPDKEVLLGLGDAYNDDPAFAAFFERIHPDLNRFMREAIQIYCLRL